MQADDVVSSSFCLEYAPPPIFVFVFVFVTKEAERVCETVLVFRPDHFGFVYYSAPVSGYSLITELYQYQLCLIAEHPDRDLR
jgi:hypothetical protein